MTKTCKKQVVLTKLSIYSLFNTKLYSSFSEYHRGRIWDYSLTSCMAVPLLLREVLFGVFGRHRILILSCLLFVLLEKIYSITKSWLKKQILKFSSKTPKLKMVIETCLFSKCHYGHFSLCPFIGLLSSITYLPILDILLDLSKFYYWPASQTSLTSFWRFLTSYPPPLTISTL